MSESPAALPPYSVLLPLAPWESPLVLRAALASLMAQSLQPSEVVVSCDGPPPQALALELERAELPLNLLFGPGGEGLGPVLARGLLACREELVLRFDADDLCLPDRALCQVQAMVSRPELAALSAPLVEFWGDPQQVSGCREVPRGSDQLRRFSRWRNPLNHPAVMLRRSRVLNVGNYRHRPGFEDYDLWLRLLRRGACLDNLARPVVLARVGPAHLGRRRGWIYAWRELTFLWACVCEGLMPWPHLALLMLLRPPLRLLPGSGLGWLMAALLRKSPLRL